MVKKKDTSIDDLADGIHMLAAAMDTGFRGVNKRIDSLEREMRQLGIRLDKLEARMTELEERMGRMEGNQKALEADVRELYRLFDELKAEYPTFNEEERRRYTNIEDFVQKVAKKTGIPYLQKSA
jgi:chromosome segregation ATPase